MQLHHTHVVVGTCAMPPQDLPLPCTSYSMSNLCVDIQEQAEVQSCLHKACRLDTSLKLL